MVEAVNNTGGTTMIKMKLAEALKGKKIYLLPYGNADGIDLKTTNVNDLIKVFGIRSLDR